MFFCPIDTSVTPFFLSRLVDSYRQIRRRALLSPATATEVAHQNANATWWIVVKNMLSPELLANVSLVVLHEDLLDDDDDDDDDQLLLFAATGNRRGRRPRQASIGSIYVSFGHDSAQSDSFGWCTVYHKKTSIILHT
jgi:hypothetical protein